MPTVQQQRDKLVSLLKQLFQLDQPDLDFGFYRIMHAKARQVTAFLESDLLKIVEQTFGQASGEKLAALQKAYEDAVAQAKLFGAPDPEQTEPVKKARAALEGAKDTSRAEGEVYDHLYRFFERYYEGGDFMSRRYLSRETSTKAAPYAVPYDGSEVYLHWANKDQYYIKTTEYFTHFSFDLSKAAEIEAQKSTLFPNAQPASLRVHFRIVAATEGEHGNVKATESTKRYFRLADADPIGFENGELVCRFLYKPDPEKTGQDATWQAKRNEQSVAGILEALGQHADPGAKVYLAALKTAAPTEKQKDRPLLARYVNQYTARNTTDYFIHKDLGGFLKRELDFYIKNEVMRLDDIESADAPAVESYLDQIRCLRRIAGKIIAFLAQLEDFQKKLWLKKKFVVETRYCVALKEIPEEFLPEIVANAAQWAEWESLHHLSELKKDDGLFARKVKLKSPEFLKANPSLMIDTRHFDADFTARLLAALGDLNEKTDGVLVHGDNFQAPHLLRQRYLNTVQCVYMDPPYNTGTDGFVYKDTYQHASWCSMLQDRVAPMPSLLTREGALLVSIDENEQPNLRLLLDSVLGNTQFVADMVWAAGRKNDSRLISVSHEYIVTYARDREWLTANKIQWWQRKKGLDDIYAQYERLKSQHKSNYKAITEGLKAWFAALPDSHPAKLHRHYSYADSRGVYFPDNISWPGGGGPKYEVLHPKTKKPVAIPAGGWRFSKPEAMQEQIAQDRIHFGDDETTVPCRKSYLSEHQYQAPYSVFYQDGRAATKRLREILGSDDFGYPKDETVLAECFNMLSAKIILDHFAGSGTTGHAVINLNREDGGRRKVILVEMADYFDTVLLPRLKKVAFTPEWKDGKPKRLATVEEAERGPRVFKIIRLESYEDTLNNLELKDDAERAKLLEQNPGLREDYMLHYMLDVETRGSVSLLNIDLFKDPTAYKLKVKKPGSDEYEWKNVDLLETFNYLIGLRVEHIAAPQTFAAEFEREVDPDLPTGQLGRLTIKGKLRQAPEEAGGKWWFRKVEGWVPKNPATPNDGQREKVLIVWRKLTGDLEQDNLVLDEWFRKYQINPRESYDYDTIYVNGSNNLPNLKLDNETWRVRLIEEDFHRLMWDTEEA